MSAPTWTGPTRDGRDNTAVGMQLGNYRLGEYLGEGGMGTVYLAHHHVLGWEAAIKVLHPHWQFRREELERFLNEARATAQLKSPHFVEIFDCGIAPDGAAYIVMERLQGETLEARLAREGALPVHEALMIVRQVAAALGVAHSCGIVHRDLKPSNVFLLTGTPEKSVKLLDLGIAKLTAAFERNTANTRSGLILGTPTYMAPEQCRGAGQIDHRADIYALGCLTFALLAGRPPFVHEGMGELIAAHLHEIPPKLTTLRPGIPLEVVALVEKALAKPPNYRQPDAASFLRQLDEAAQKVRADIPAPAPRRPSLRKPVMITSLLCGLAAIGIVTVRSYRPQPLTGAWKTQPLGAPSRLVDNPQVAVGPGAGFLAAWRQATGASTSLFASIHDGHSWTSPTQVDEDKPDQLTEPSVAAGGNQALVVWMRRTGPQSVDLWARPYQHDKGWRDKIRLAELSAPQSRGVAVDSDGTGVVAWNGADDGETVWAATFDSAKGFATPERLDTPGRPSIQAVRATAAGHGILLVSWIESVADHQRFVFRMRTNNGRWSPVATIVEGLPNELGRPQIALDEHGAALATWRQNSGTLCGVQANHKPAAAGFGTPVSVLELGPGDCGDPEAALAHTGDGVVIWRQADGVLTNVWARRFAASAGTWRASEIVAAATERADKPHVAMDENSGAAIAVWQQGDGAQVHVLSNRLDPVRGWVGPEPLDGPNVLGRDPDIAVGEGRAAAVWVQGSGGRHSLWTAIRR